ncbi:hypothetical protein RGQ29_006107 [Quercus rubra]|uniref:DUF7870 domain-containing protein n=1 Tax=Quercus rubra TaxID=3512 RepID=A0AAN7E6F8_QUERU|nr:hypothetical protein RGQ29_006107 [Quercus rubra]
MKHLHGGRMGLNSNTLWVIRLPHSMVLCILSRSLFLALVIILTSPCIFRGPEPNNGSEDLNLLFRDLASEGLLRKGDKALILSSGIVRMVHHYNASYVMDSDLEGQRSIPDETFDFVFTFTSLSFGDTLKVVNRVMKIGGILAILLNNEPPSPNGFRKQSNYRILHSWRYNNSTIMVFRKVIPFNEQRRLCKSNAMNFIQGGLEGVLLEPPRRTRWRSTQYKKKIKFLPDLLGDNLESYKRRVFIVVGLPEKNVAFIEWFQQNYPKRNQEFEKILSRLRVDFSDWLMNNVTEEVFVVMKADAEVVEKMIERRTICLVDELFLECKNHWWRQNRERYKSKRPYWECVALYGRLLDEGVAVHQWWGVRDLRI